MTLFLADLDPDHVEIREIPKLGRNAVNSNEVTLHELPVAAADVVVRSNAEEGVVEAIERVLAGR